MSRQLVIGLNAVIVAVTEDQPRILTVRAGGPGASLSLPFGPFDPDQDRTLELGLREWVRSQTGNELGYVEQLYTFADQDRDPREQLEGERVLSIAYLALVREGEVSGTEEASWQDGYRFLPWEDWRGGRPASMDGILQALGSWSQHTQSSALRRQREERIEICFGLGDAGWDGYQVLERYELLYEADLVAEAWRDDGRPVPDSIDRSAADMALDHRRILATALGRLRGKLRYRPLVFELMPATFTLLQLQKVVEALTGIRLHKQNFRRLVESAGLVEGTGELEPRTGGRPAERFRFRREVLRERRAPGVGVLSLLRAERG